MALIETLEGLKFKVLEKGKDLVFKNPFPDCNCHYTRDLISGKPLTLIYGPSETYYVLSYIYHLDMYLLRKLQLIV